MNTLKNRKVQNTDTSVNHQYIGKDDFEGIPCYVFRMQATIGKKVNTYTLTVEQKTSAPKRYEMRGYDTLLGSHYDKYEILYTMFNATTLSDDIFEIPKGLYDFFVPFSSQRFYCRRLSILPNIELQVMVSRQLQRNCITLIFVNVNLIQIMTFRHHKENT